MTAPVTAEKPLSVRETARLGSMRREHGASKGLAFAEAHNLDKQEPVLH